MGRGALARAERELARLAVRILRVHFKKTIRGKIPRVEVFLLPGAEMKALKKKFYPKR